MRLSFPSRCRASLAFLALPLVLLLACGKPPPLRVGLLAELSGPSADVGEAIRNGAALALDEAQSEGLLQGRPLALRVRDTGLHPASAREAVGGLMLDGVDFIIGPGTSAMAAAVLPAVNEAQVVMISPTATAVEFHGLDDYLFRVNWTTRDNAGHYARHYHARGHTRFAVAVNADNRAFAQSWLTEFRDALLPLGGQLVLVEEFNSAAEEVGPLAARLLAAPADAILFVASAADTARLAQQVRKRDAQRPLIAAEWAGTQQLIELGGRAVDGMLLVQNFDAHDSSAAYRRFLEAYVARFGKSPSFHSVLAYDGTRAALQAASRQTRGQSFKQALLAHGPYQGAQQPLRFDANGDTGREAYFMLVREGRFVREP